MSTVVQTTYRPQIAAGAIGMIVDETHASVNTRMVETSGGVGFGLAVSQGVGDTGCVIGGSAFIGVTVRDVTLDRVPIDPQAPVGTILAADTYPQYANAGVMSTGHIWVAAGAGSIKANDAAFYDQTVGKFSNSASGLAATGNVTFTGQPAAAQTITLNGTTWTFVASGATGNQVNIGSTLGDTVQNLATALSASADVNTKALQYWAYPPSPAGRLEGSAANQLNYAATTVGTAGNAISVSTNVTGATVSGTNGALAGGSAAATAIVGGYFLNSAKGGDLVQLSLGIQR